MTQTVFSWIVAAALFSAVGALAKVLWEQHSASVTALNIEPSDAWVIDGDTLVVPTDRREWRVRLWGIDAPEMDTVAGIEARAALVSIMRTHRSICEYPEAGGRTDRYGRHVMRCTLHGGEFDGQDLACVMVARGHAVDWPRYSGGAYSGPLFDCTDLGR